MSDIRPMTKSEAGWWAELKCVLRRMPKNVEIQARIGEIGIAPIGSRETIFLRDGDLDNLDELEWEAILVSRLDGRDNHL